MGGCLSQCMLGYTPRQVNPRAGTHPQQVQPLGRYTPSAGTPPEQVHPPQKVHPQAGTPPNQVHPGAGTLPQTMTVHVP